MTDLRERASNAFSPLFRAALADACQREFRRVGACYCPQAALMGLEGRNPDAHGVAVWCHYSGFESCASGRLHLDFQEAFDKGDDRDTPESALGLLYRQRFVRDQ
jgi:hypothetical protein